MVLSNTCGSAPGWALTFRQSHPSPCTSPWAFARAASQIAFMRSISASGDIRQILNPLRDILHALNRRVLQAERPSATEEHGAILVDVRKSCTRVVMASWQALTLARICSSVTRASHVSRAFARLTHLCFDDQRSHVCIVVRTMPEISPVEVVLTWY